MTPYRLHTLLQLREHEQRNAEIELMEVVDKWMEQQLLLRQAQAQLQQLLELQQQQTIAMHKHIAASNTTASTYCFAQQHISYLFKQEQQQRSMIDDLQRQLSQANEDLKARKAELKRAIQDRKALEKHHQQWSTHRHQRHMRLEESILDEIGQLISQSHK